MLKFLIILLIGLSFESIGVVMLKKGMGKIGDVKEVSVSEVARVVKAGATNSSILLGVFFEALFFATLLILMSRSDISLLWPLTGLSFVFATIAARAPSIACPVSISSARNCHSSSSVTVAGSRPARLYQPAALRMSPSLRCR